MPFGGTGSVFGDDIFGVWCDSTTATSTATTSVIWTGWNDNTATTATNATSGGIYHIWVRDQMATNQTTITQYTNGTGQIWGHWQSASGQSGLVSGQQQAPWLIHARQTPEEIAAARRREEEYREHQKVEAERYRAAKERAEGLLYEHLTDEQRAEIKRSKFFVVVGGKTGRRYKINAGGGVSGNVHEIDEKGALRRRLCAHIEHAANAPIFDHLLAQKLMLEYHEEAFLKVANDHGR